MAATFLKAQSYEIGRSIFEADRLEIATGLLKKASQNGIKLFLSVDVAVADSIDTKDAQIVSVKDIPANKMIVDIGPQTISQFTEVLKKSRTVFWNGPMGVYEYPQFAGGTRAMAKLLAGLQATTIIGGGSTAEIVTEMGLADKITFVSTGGGASMSFVSGEKLPGVEVLLDKKA
jgi:phosphoglycerate kinase